MKWLFLVIALLSAPLAGAAELRAGGELRLRREAFADNLWGGAAPADDAYLLWRAMPRADLSAGPLSLSTMLIAARARGLRPEPGPADATGIDLLQASAAWALLADGPVTATLTGGRELLSFGSERLIGRRYGANIPQAFDGGRLTLAGQDWRADLFTARPVLAGPGDFDDKPARGRSLRGLYASSTAGWTGLDAYLLFTGNDRATYVQDTGRERRRTAGIRLFGSHGNWSWNWEAMAQWGGFAGQSIRAWSLASETGYALPDLPLSPRLLLRANIASGDHDPGDGRLGTFNPLFPKAKYFGELTPIGPRNMINLHPGLELDLGNGFDLTLAGLFYWRESRQDGLYSLPGGLLRPGDAAAGRYVGHQGELVLGWEQDGFSAAASLSAFAPGRFLRHTGPSRTIIMTGLELGWAF